MSSSNEEPPDDLDESVMAAHALFRKGKREGACRFLAQKRDEAVSSGELDEASMYATLRGSYMIAMGKDNEALEAFLEAEELSQGEVHSVLRTARHLLNGMKQPDKALEKVDSVLASEVDSYPVSAHGTRGLALLALNQPEEASKELQKVLVGIDQLLSRSCDLILVEALSKKNLVPELCQRYLDVVESKARVDGEERVLKRVLKIKALLE